MAKNLFNIEEYVKQGLNTSSQITDVNTKRLNDYLYKDSKDYSPGYSFFDWARDAASDYYRAIQRGEMHENQDRMLAAKQTIDYATDLIDAISYEPNNEEEELAISSKKNEAIKNLRDTGIWTQKKDPSIEELQEIINNKNKVYDEEYQSYLHNKEQLEESLNNYDISQYYTRKSNEAVMGWGNWEFKMPATMGTSMTSPFLQTTSMAGGFAGALAGAKAGAAIGSVVPGAGTIAGTILGALGGLVGSQLLGGMQSRENESHMEAFNGYYERVMEEARKNNIDTAKIAGNMRQQFIDRGVDVTNLTDSEIIQAGLADNNIKSGSAEFNEIADKAYKGSRRLYERNNALGVGEAISDLTYILPLPGVNQLIKGAFKGIGKGIGKITPNVITSALDKRFQTGLNIAAAGAKARNKKLMSDISDYLIGKGVRGVSEATEEGSQSILSDQYMRGLYDDEPSNATFFDAVADGQVFKDLFDNVWFRARSLGAAMGIDDEYKDDKQMSEEMLAGFLLSWTNPQGAVISSAKAISELNKLSQLPKVSRYLEKSLAKQDFINRTEEYFRNVREGLPSGNTWNEALDLIADELKSVGPDGTTRKYNLDATVLTDGQTPASNDQIDAFIKGQKELSNNLYAYRQSMLKKMKAINLEGEDQDLYLSLAYAAKLEKDETDKILDQFDMLDEIDNISSGRNKDFTDAVDSMNLTNEELSEEEYALVKRIITLNRRLDHIDQIMSQYDSNEKVIEYLRNKKHLKREYAVEEANSLIGYTKQRQQIVKELNDVINTLKKNHNDIDEVDLRALDTTTADENDLANKLNAAKYVDIKVYQDMLNQKKNDFQNPTEEFARNKVNAYRETKKRQAKLADEANQAAVTNTDIADSTTGTSEVSTDKVQDMTKEAVEAEKTRIQDNVTTEVNRLQQVLDSIPQESYLYGLVDYINRGRTKLTENPLDLARYMSRIIKRMKYQYNKGEAFESASAEDKTKIENIINAADNIEKQLDRMLELNAEEKAKAERHNAGFKNTQDNSVVWTDEKGNRYILDNPSAEYSENEGLILTLKRVGDNIESKQYTEAAKNLRKQIESLQKDSEKNPSNKEVNDKYISVLQKDLDKINKVKESITDSKIIMNAAENADWLNSLTTVDNNGNVTKITNIIGPMIAAVNNKIAENKNHRNLRATVLSSDGDVFDFSDYKGERAKTKPSWREAYIPFVDGAVKRVKAYALGTSFGAKQESKLMNAFHAAKFWYGNITMPYRSVESAKSYLSKISTFVRDGKEYSRFKAIELFNKIGGQIAYRKKNGTFNVNEVMSALETMALGKTDEMKIAGVKVTKEDYVNMIYALPLMAHMYQKHTGGQATIVHLADYGSEDRKHSYSNEEFNSRAGLIHDLLKSFKSLNNQEPDLESLEGYSFEDVENDKVFQNRVYFSIGDVQLVYGDFDYSTRTIRNVNSKLFVKQDGTQMNQSEVNEYYSSKSTHAAQFASQHVDELVELLHTLGYTLVDKDYLLKPATSEMLNTGDPDGLTIAGKLMQGVLKYGDGVIDYYDGLMSKYANKLLGQVQKDNKNIKDAALSRSRALLEFTQNIMPELFLSYQKNIDRTDLSFPIRETIVQALEANWFNRLGAIHVYQEGVEIDHTNKPENVDNLTAIFENIEQLLRISKTAEEFMNRLNDAGYTFKQGDSKQKAEDTLIEYFNNRKFSRLQTPSTVAQAITMGSATPMNKAVNYRNFDRVTEHVNHKINEVKALGLTKDEEGRYHFSIEKWQQKNVDTKSKSNEDGSLSQSEYEQLLEKEKAPYQALIDKVGKIKRHEAMVEFLSEKATTIPEVREILEEYYKLNDDGVYIPKRGTILALVRNEVVDMSQEAIDDLDKTYKEKYIKKVQTEIKADDAFAGYKHALFSFAYGSYESSAGAAIVYYDVNGNKHVVENAKGTPGAMYFLLPSFMTAARQQQVIRLNPAKIDTSMAQFLASLLNEVRKGNIKMDSFVNNLTITNDMGSFTVDADCTVQTLLDNIVFNGKAAVINNPTDNNYERLLYVENNQVYFGERTLTEDNIDELVQFIEQNKNYRIDREKATNPNARVGSNISIKKDGNSLFSRNANDNYVASVIDNGMLLTDLNTSEKSSLFVKPSVYISFNNSRGFKGVANDPQSTGSAANSKEKLGDSISREETQEWLSNRQSSDTTEGTTDAASYTEKLFVDFKTKLNKLLGENKIPNGKIKLLMYNRKSSKVVQGEELVLRPAFDEATGEVAFELVDTRSTFLTKYAFALENGAQISLVAADENGKFLEVDGKPVFAYGDPNKVTKKQAQTSEKNYTPSQGAIDFSTLPAGTTIQQNGMVITIGGGGIAQPTTGGQISVPTSTPTNVPSGFVGLTPVTPTAVSTTQSAVQPQTVKEFRINGDASDDSVNDLVLEAGLTKEQVLERVNSYANEYEATAFEDFIFDYDSIDKLYEDYLKETDTTVPTAIQPTDTTDGTPTVGGLGIADTGVVTPLTRFTKPTIQPISQPTQTTGQEIVLPSANQMIKWGRENGHDQIVKKFIDNVHNAFGKDTPARMALAALYQKYVQAKYNVNSNDAARMFSRGGKLFNSFNTKYGEYQAAGANMGLIFDFLSNHVEKEDFQAAYERVQKILGKDFDLSFLPNIEKHYDQSREAMVYVYGQCVSAGIRIFRDARSNKIVKGSMYHEAFHRVSLFILSKEQRQKMYQDAREQYSELLDKSDLYVEEFLADKFADFVNDQISNRQKKFYSKNFIVRQFQKLYDTIRTLMNRFIKANITPDYVDMNKLFKDMYSGRYAYAKATKNNLELFDKVYSGITPYAGMEIDGVEIAYDVNQYQEIRRDIIGRLVRTGNILSNKEGGISVNMDEVKKQMIADLRRFVAARDQIEAQVNGDYKNVPKAYESQDLDEALLQMHNLIYTYEKVLSDEAWKVWSETIEDFCKNTFGIINREESDPNTMLNGDTEQTEEVPGASAFDQTTMSFLRDSYMRDMYASAHVNMKLLLWSIVDGDKNNPENMKFTMDGLMVYAKVAKLFNDITLAVQDSQDTKDMLDKLEVAAQKAIQENNDYTLQQFYETISHRNTVQAIRNRVFTDFVRHRHIFVNYFYESEEVYDYTDEKGNQQMRPQYTASVRRGDADAVSQSMTSQWKTNISMALDSITSALLSGQKLSVLQKPLKQATDKLRVNDIESIKRVLMELNALYGLKFEDNDYQAAAEKIQRIMKNTNSVDILKDVVKALNNIDSSVYKQSTGQTSARFNKYNKIMKDLFEQKGAINTLIERLGSQQRPDPKTNSQRGAGDTKVYSIGAYNFITRLFGARIKTKEWRDRMRKNPYCSHSQWLAEIGDGTGKKVYTKLATVLDNDYQNSTPDIEITDINDLLNKLLTIANGRHVAPSLANKRFALEIGGFSQPVDIINSDLSINPAVVKQFVDYLADEILAISDAKKTRQLFIDRLNDALKPKVPYTAESFSKLSSVEQEEIFRNSKEAASLLGMLVKQYHFKEGPATFSMDENNNRIVRRVFHIDLRKGSGYEFRHFKKLGKLIRLYQEDIDAISENVLNPGDNAVNRKAGIKIAEQIASRYEKELTEILRQNIAVTVNKFIALDIIRGNRPDVLSGSVDVNSLTNRYIPLNTINRMLGMDENARPTISGNMLYRVLANYTINSMIDLVEFEKIVTGDTGYHKDITSVNKRYSGPVSTTQITAEIGVIRNALEEDRLYDSPTYNTITVNTSLVVNTRKFEGDMFASLGINVVTGYTVKKGTVLPVTDYKMLLDENKNIKEEYRNAPLVSRYLDHLKKGRTSAMNADGTPMTEEQLAKVIVDKAVTNFINYLNNDPSDAQTFVTAEMFRQARQREGLWNEIDEASYNLLEHYDEITRLIQTDKDAYIREMCKYLKIDYDDLVKRAKQFDEDYANNNQQGIDAYKGWIYNVTKNLDATSLKYVYYGEPSGREDGLYVPIYDKSSWSPVFKIFADGHQMKEIYDFMKDNKVDLIKLESAVKSGGIPSFELFDAEGNFNRRSLENAVVQQQYFNLVGKQLNTDPHEAGQTSLLTQFMKIAMMNINDDDILNIGGNNMRGNQVKTMYKNILDFLTKEGLKAFNEEWGVTKNGLDKATFMKKLQSMAKTQNLPADTVNAFTVDDNGEFVINPAALPNIKWVQSRILSEMGKKIIDTTTPGMPLYQVASIGYDNIFNIKGHKDVHLRMPGEPDENGVPSKRMQVKLSIKFFEDIIKQAQKAAQKGELKGYGDLSTFDQQRRFILDNQELFALSYRVPTQGQNSTIPVEIVDVFPPIRGAIISFPAGVTAQTGSDFDIDKMFLARYNYEIKNGRLQKVKYDVKELTQLVLSGKPATKYQKAQLQNMLLDMYQAVLTSPDHYLAANTPLDVCTAPLSTFARSFTPSDNEIVTKLPDASDVDKRKIYLMSVRNQNVFRMYQWNDVKADYDMIGERPMTDADYENMIDGYHLGTVFQTAQKLKNAGSDGGIGPMALNSVFRFFTQVSGLRLLPNEYLHALGIDDITAFFDRNGEDILDITSALINAHVDAVKDNYIGAVNVNGYTYDITAFLTSAGFGNDTFAFLTQPILKEVAQNWQNYKNGVIGVSPSMSKGMQYLRMVKDKWEGLAISQGYDGDLNAKASAEEMSVEYLKEQAASTEPNATQQLRYLNTFMYINEIAQSYHTAISSAQIDTKKYGISADELISFIQVHDDFVSQYNLAFSNPQALFDDTFLGTKYDSGVLGMFDTFGSTIFEFSPVYKAVADELSKQYGKYGAYSKKFLKRVGPKIKAAYMLPFFNQYLVENIGGEAPLARLVMGSESVPGRFHKIKNKCLSMGIGSNFFNVVNYNPMLQDKIPQFFVMDNSVREDDDVKSAVQASMSELFNSDDPEIRKWMNDFAVYMFYITAGTDTNAGGVVKTSLFDLLPPQHLSNITTSIGTYNQYVTNHVMNNSSTRVDQNTLDLIMMMVALTDDDIIQTLTTKEAKSVINEDIVYVGFGSQRLMLRDQGTFEKFIKVKDKSGNINLYKLGDIGVTESKSGNLYQNPIYYRVATLGYRNKARAVFSVRADGYVAADGSIHSLLNRKQAFYAQKYDDLNEKDKQIFDRKMSNLKERYSTEDAIQHNPAYKAVDEADKILYYNDGSNQDLRGYAKFRNKDFEVLDGSNPTIAPNSTVLILGNIPQDYLDRIKEELPEGVTIITKDSISNANNVESDSNDGMIDGFTNVIENSTGNNRAEAYADRTKKNARWADLTIAFAVDFNTAGERLTATAAGDKYYAIKLEENSEDAVSKTFTDIIKRFKGKNGLKINIAGNGLYTLNKYSFTQEQANETVKMVLYMLSENGLNIAEVRSGGQTGFDEAGVKAADALGIKWSILAPKDYWFRDANNKNISGREAFMARFEGLSYKGDTSNQPVQLSLFSGLIQPSTEFYNRESVRKDKDTLYIFTDNTERTSGGTRFGQGWYRTKYGSGGYGSSNNPTSAIIRGLENAYPISTMKYFKYNHKDMTLSEARWKDSDIEEFKEIIDDEIEQIKRAWSTGKYKKIVTPVGEDAFFNSKRAKIQPDSEIGKYLEQKLKELNDFVNTDMTLEEKKRIGNEKRKQC